MAATKTAQQKGTTTKPRKEQKGTTTKPEARQVREPKAKTIPVVVPGDYVKASNIAGFPPTRALVTAVHIGNRLDLTLTPENGEPFDVGSVPHISNAGGPGDRWWEEIAG